MDPLDDKLRKERILRVEQVVHIVVVTENDKGTVRETSVHSIRRPIPVPYTEEP